MSFNQISSPFITTLLFENHVTFLPHYLAAVSGSTHPKLSSWCVGVQGNVSYLDLTKPTIHIVDLTTACGTSEEAFEDLDTDNPHAQPSTRASNPPTVPDLHNLAGVCASCRNSSSPWPQAKSLARKMSTDASTRPKRQLVKAACQSCQKRKVKVRTSSVDS